MLHTVLFRSELDSAFQQFSVRDMLDPEQVVCPQLSGASDPNLLALSAH